MDCRKSLVLALGFVGAAGCVPQTTMPTVPTQPGQPVVVEKAKDPPTHPPAPATCVALGDFFAAEGASAEKGSVMQEQRYDKARRSYQEALALDANCLPAYLALGRLYVDMGDQERAVETYQKGLAKHAKYAPLWFELGWKCYARHKDWAQAIQALRKAVELDPENQQYQNMLGSCLARAGRYDEALSVLSKSGGEAHAHYYLARMLHHMNQDAAARQHLQAAVKADPRLEGAQRMLAQLEGREPADPAVMQAGAEAPGDGTPAQQ
jgi:tetratricopeptide (TPR) repeat protein